MSETSASPPKLRRHSTSLVYAKASGQVLHISHVEVVQGATPSPELLSEIERSAVDEASRIHGVSRDELAVIALDPNEFKLGLIYSVDPSTGTVKTKPIKGSRKSSPSV